MLSLSYDNKKMPEACEMFSGIFYAGGSIRNTIEKFKVLYPNVDYICYNHRIIVFLKIY